MYVDNGKNGAFLEANFFSLTADYVELEKILEKGSN